MNYPPWIHVTQTLSVDGSTVNNVIRELSAEASALGIRSSVVGSDNRNYNFPNAEIIPVDFTSYLRNEYLLRREYLTDVITGRLGVGRRSVRRLFQPVAEAIDGTSGPVIVHDGFLGAAGLRVIAGRHPHRKLFLYVHNSLSRSYGRRELIDFISRAQAVICVSNAVRHAIADRIGDHPAQDRLVTILNGVDTRRFAPGKTPRSGPPAVLFSGVMAEHKGPHILIEALIAAAQEGLQFTATFLGSSEHASGIPLSTYEKGLRRDAAKLRDRVSFLPFQPNAAVPDIYRQHDVLVVPSQFDEPFGLVLAEGMATGLAALSTRRGGLPEVGGDAVQYFSGHSDLLQLLRPLLQSETIRRDWGDKALSRAHTLTWARTMDSLRHLIDETAS